LAVAVSLVRPAEQLADLQPVRPNPVDRRDGTVEDVVEALEFRGPLEGEDVERLLHDAEPAAVPGRIPADGAERLVADVEAAVAEEDTGPHARAHRREGAGGGLRGPL